MDIFDFDLTTGAERGFTFNLRNPLTGEKTDAEITVVGSDSKAYRRAKTEAMREAVKADGAFDDDEFSASVYSKCVTAWSGVNGRDGEPLECTAENAKQVMTDLPWFMDQVGGQIDKRSNFTKPAEKS
jgi:hypothetical protein